MTGRADQPHVAMPVTRWMERLPLARGRFVVGSLTTLAIVGLAWLLRVVADPFLPPGFPYVTFFPAVIVTSFLFGVRLGGVSALLCGLIAWYFYINPVNSFALPYGAQAALAFYVFVVATDLALVHWMQNANRLLINEREVNRQLADSKEQMVRELEHRITERNKAADALLESEVQTHLATQTAGIGLWQWNVRTGQIRWDRTMFELYGMVPTADGLVPYSDYIGSVHPDDAAAQDAILQDTVARSGSSQREFRIQRRDDGRVRHLRAVEAARAGTDGKTEWVVGTNLDISEQRDREAHVQLLMGEINHRAKNMLGVVMAVAHQTSGTDHAEFMLRFSARIQSLAAGQDLLVDSQWKGVELEMLARAQLDHFKDLIGDRITLSGCPALLSPSAVQAIGMALHELATNASKYGALSNDQGRVAIAWHHVPASRRFVITWHETGGPPVIPPTRRGFGSIVTGKMVRMSLDGDVSADYAPSGFSWRLECPSDKIIDDRISPGLEHESGS
ncbi:HWE histidine kinase domain-containing protein [Polymorphobacter sp.]|uniref:HWE histidine kinase domain-containing protein n=1 Tax=Polymorphobacter sp. TaxID=1909290 RepID=UPI003F6F596C